MRPVQVAPKNAVQVLGWTERFQDSDGTNVYSCYAFADANGRRVGSLYHGSPSAAQALAKRFNLPMAVGRAES